MSLVRTLLQENTDSSFIDDILANTSVKNSSELVTLLTQGQTHGFSERLLLYMFDEYEQIIKDAVKHSYHPVIIKYLQQYGLQQGREYWNIANHPFIDQDMLYDFFSHYKNINIPYPEIEKIAQKAFSDCSMLLGSSYVYLNKDTLYITFSKIKKYDPDSNGMVKIEFLEKNITSREWHGLHHISKYLEEKCSDFSLFDILKLDANKVL